LSEDKVKLDNVEQTEDKVGVEESAPTDEDVYNDEVVVGGKKYRVGQLDAKTIAGIANLIGKKQFDGRKIVESMKLTPQPSDFLWGILSSLEEDDLIILASLLIDADRAYVKENFNIGWVSEALAIAFERSDLPIVIKNFSRITAITLG
jgi:hypothetical protein